MKPLIPLALISLATIQLAHGLEVNIDRVDDSGLPWGYIDVSDFGVDEDPQRLARQNSLEYDHARSLQVSDAPYVDYFVAFNSGIAGVLAEKIDGPFLDASQSTVPALTGGGNGGFVPDFAERSSPDRYSSGEMPVGSEKFSAFASWTDGAPLPSANSWWGVSWGGWSATEVVEMEVRVNLASEQPVNIAHLFNDGWYYSSDIGTIAPDPQGTTRAHEVLDGHEFTVTHHAADGSVIAEQKFVLSSGGGGSLQGVANAYAAELGVVPSSNNVREDGKFYLITDWRQFYTATITATRQAEGDYLMIHHRAANIGYRMTLVTLGDDRPWALAAPFALVPGETISDTNLGDTFGYSTAWGYSALLGAVHVALHPDAIYSVNLGWLAFPNGSAAEGLFLYSTATSNWIWTRDGLGGAYFDYASGEWASIQ